MEPEEGRRQQRESRGKEGPANEGDDIMIVRGEKLEELASNR